MELVNNEILCFLQNKAKVMTFDDLVKISCDFYTCDEAVTAQAVLSKYVSDRLTKHTGTDKKVKLKKIITDLLKCILDANNDLPQFCCSNLSRLPPVSADHVDVAALWQELSYLRAEVREVAALRAELQEVKSALSDLQHRDFPPLWSSNAGEHSSVSGNQPSTSVIIDSQISAASVVQEAVKSGALQKQRSRRKVVVGSKVDSKVKPVVTRRCVDVFLSRLQPDTTVADIESCTSDIMESIPNGDLSQVDIKCTHLPGKHDFYTSFHVAVTVNSDVFATAIDVLMSGDSWPKGILVRRYFQKRQQNG